MLQRPRIPRHALVRVRGLSSKRQTSQRKADQPMENLNEEAARAQHRFAQMQVLDPLAHGFGVMGFHYVPGPRAVLQNSEGWRGFLRWLWLPWLNRVQNFTSLFNMARHRSFPADLKHKSRFGAYMFRLGSTKPNAWIAPLRTIALDTYTKINEAVAAGDIAALNRAAAYRYHKLARQRIPPMAGRNGVAYEWKLHRLVKPVKCLAIRATPAAPLDRCREPGSSPFMVQTLFRIDTMQSLSVKSKRAGSAQKSAAPAQPTRITEYIVLEKRNWDPNTPWKIVAAVPPGKIYGEPYTLKEVFNIEEDLPET